MLDLSHVTKLKLTSCQLFLVLSLHPHLRRNSHVKIGQNVLYDVAPAVFVLERSPGLDLNRPSSSRYVFLPSNLAHC